MKKYRVNVNGTVYEVEVEDITGAPTEAPIRNADPVPAKVSSGEGETIKAPMPGNILDVKVKPGDLVRAGDVLMILEAMKMENEIMCPRDARVISVAVRKGDSVDPDSVLCVID